MDAPGQDTRGSFLKLVDTIAWEIGEFRQEMVQTDRTAGGRSPGSPGHLNLHRDMGNASLEKRETKTFLRDSGYESYSHKLSILDKLLHTHAIWLQLGLSESETLDILQSQPPGTFLVRKSMKLQRKVISLRLPKESETCLKEYAIKESSYTFSVEGSGISFADLFRLIAFHCISRDVLPFTLKLPPAITQAKSESELEDIAHLGLSFWQSPIHNRPPPPPAPPKPLPCDSRGPPRQQQPAARTNGVQSLHTRTPSELECSQGNGALCFINPLFLEVHPQDSASKRQILRAAPAVKNGGVERRARSPPPPRPPPPALLQSPQLCRAVKQETAAAAASMPEIVSCPQLNGSSSSGGHPPAAAKAPAPIPPPRRKKSQLSLQPPPQPTVYIEWEITAPRLASELLQSCPSAPLAVRTDMASSPQQQQQQPPTGQRLSDLSISTSSSDSLERTIPFYDYEGDSFESDPESSMAPPLKPRKKRSSSFGFPKMVKTQLRKMSGVFSSLMTPEKKMVKRIAELSRDKRTYLGSLVQDYISFLRENRECHVSVTDMLQTIRQFMTQVKNYLAQSSELDPPIETFIPEDQIDAVLEKAMHKCILKPLKCHIDATLKEFHTADGSWRQLKENLQLVRQRNPQELGVFAPVPDFVDVEKIKVKLMTMQKMYSPEKKVMLLLRVCKLIYTCMENNSGRMYGADDFLPMLTYVIAQCDMLELETEIEYMMELLDPVLLHGEGGYYLTSAYGALSLIKNFQEEQAARLLSSEARNTLRQWHKRRTTNRTIPSVDDFQKDESDALVNKETFISAAQNYLRVALQEVESGCTGKTLIVKPYTTTEEVCQICAERFKVQDPECYGLFLYIDETWQQLTEDTYPQKIKAELHSRPQPQVFHFVYKRINSTFAGIFNYEDNDADFSHLAS